MKSSGYICLKNVTFSVEYLNGRRLSTNVTLVALKLIMLPEKIQSLYEKYNLKQKY